MNGKEPLKWAELNTALPKVSEKECYDILNLEFTSKKRPSFLLRIYGRLSFLRAQRERDQLLKGKSLPKC
jgi:hypothetical protein